MPSSPTARRRCARTPRAVAQEDRMSDNALARKLLLKAGRRMLVLNAPPGFLAGFTPLPEGGELTEEAVGQLDVVLLFVRNQAELEEYLPRARDAIKYDALLWIAYPKGGAK